MVFFSFWPSGHPYLSLLFPWLYLWSLFIVFVCWDLYLSGDFWYCNISGLRLWTTSHLLLGGGTPFQGFPYLCAKDSWLFLIFKNIFLTSQLLRVSLTWMAYGWPECSWTEENLLSTSSFLHLWCLPWLLSQDPWVTYSSILYPQLNKKFFGLCHQNIPRSWPSPTTCTDPILAWASINSCLVIFPMLGFAPWAST